jgi:hypothetical protein
LVKTMFWQHPLFKGWYQVKVIIFDSNGVEQATTSSKFGVGDVFIIAGQSNAQGYTGLDDPSVVPYYRNGSTQLPDCVNVDTSSVIKDNLPLPTGSSREFQSLRNFVKLGQKKHKIYPNGVDTWCYAELGKDIVNVTKAPVAFFNAGASGSEIDNWVESIPQNPVTQGLTHFRFSFKPNGSGGYEPCIYNPQDPNECPADFFGKYPTTPYVPLRNTLQMQGSMMGVRAILWHQGETDSERRHGSSDFSYYQNRFNTLKNRLISDFKDENNNNQNNLSFFISKVSFWRSYPDNPYAPRPNWSDQKNQNLVDKQAILGNSNHIGADTDGIGMQSNINNPFDSTRARKIDGFNVHFSNYGLRLLADKWLASQPWTGNPISGKPLLPISITHPSVFYYQLTAPAGYAKYYWVVSGKVISNYVSDKPTLYIGLV